VAAAGRGQNVWSRNCLTAGQRLRVPPAAMFHAYFHVPAKQAHSLLNPASSVTVIRLWLLNVISAAKAQPSAETSVTSTPAGGSVRLRAPTGSSRRTSTSRRLRSAMLRGVCTSARAARARWSKSARRRLSHEESARHLPSASLFVLHNVPPYCGRSSSPQASFCVVS
jgi:hypothetical protein